MTQTLQRTIVMLVMALLMMAALIGWAVLMRTSTPVYHSASSHASHSVAYICPPPPFDCSPAH